MSDPSRLDLMLLIVIASLPLLALGYGGWVLHRSRSKKSLQRSIQQDMAQAEREVIADLAKRRERLKLGRHYVRSGDVTIENYYTRDLYPRKD